MNIRNLIRRMRGIAIFALWLILFIVFGEGSGAFAQESIKAATPQKVIHIKMSEFAYQPDSLVIPAGELVQLDFQNVGQINHEFMAGHKVTEDGDGFTDDLFKGVEVEMTKNGKPAPASAMMMGEHMMANEEEKSESHEMEEHENNEEHGHGMTHHGTMLLLGPGDKGTMTFTLPASAKGKWQIGCFTDGGSHYAAGMKGVLVVK